MLRRLFSFLFFLVPAILLSRQAHDHSAIRFTANIGQWDPNILYRAQLDGGALFLEPAAFTYHFYDKEALRANHVNAKGKEPRPVRSHAFRVLFEGAQDGVRSSGLRPSSDYNNYFIGSDPSRWKSQVPNYREVNYENLYPGIDLQILGQDNSLKYNLIVSAYASAEAIKMKYEGVEQIKLERGSLVIKTSVNELTEQAPYAYQIIEGKKLEVPCRFVLSGSTVSFSFPRGYNEAYELIIDPVLVFACSSGSTADNFGMTATYDDDGNLYGGGTCFDIGYPVTTGAFDGTYNGIVLFGRTDVVITKYDASGVFLHYSTYIGGAVSTEVVSSLIVNSNDELMLFGATGSSDFPVTAGAFDVSFNGGTNLFFAANGTEYTNGTDLYISKFNAAGTALIASTFVGGTLNEGANASTLLGYNYGDYYRGEIQTDAAGNCYVASCTFSSDFPVTPGCFQPVAGGGMDGVVFKMPPNLSALTWSSYLGGNSDDGCYALTIDNALNVYTTGGTASLNFPVTAGTLGTTYHGGITDGFITKIQNTGTAIMRSTMIGTPVYDQGFLIQLDNNNDVYIVGQTEGTMPVSPGVYSNANSKQFIWQLNNDLSTQIFTTNIGNGSGQVNISPSAFLVDTCGNIYVCGWGGNILTGAATTGMPVTADALQPATDGFNFYLMVLTPDAASLLYGTYFGGGQSQEHIDGGTSRFDKRGIVYHGVCSGCGGNDDFPVTPGSWPNTGANVNHSTNCNMGVFKFDFQAAGVSAEADISPNDTICAGGSITFNNASANAVNYLWDFGDGSPQSSASAPVHVYASPGDYTVMLIAFDSTGCIFSDTTFLTVNVVAPPLVDIGNDTMFCSEPFITLSGGTTTFSYLWSTGSTSPSIIADTSGLFWVTKSNGICAVSDSITLGLYPPPALGPDTALCSGQTITLAQSYPGATYLWSNGSASNSVIVSTAGDYWVQIDYGPCQLRDTISVTYLSYPPTPLPDSLNLCPGNLLTLDAGAGATSYLWSTDQTTQTIDVSGGGMYTVAIGNQHCISWDSTFIVAIAPVAWEREMSLCNITTFTLHAGAGGVSYLWSTGETTESIEITADGQYWVVMGQSGCTLSDTVTVYGELGSGVLWFPNSFTPNANGLNDEFRPKGVDISEYHLQIFDRWGELIFETRRPEEAWNGTYKGRLCKQDVYVWKTDFKTKCGGDLLNHRVGHVSLIR
jgi:gliding motility-associated-like protein